MNKVALTLAMMELLDHGGEEDDLCSQHDDEDEGERSADNVEHFGVRLQQIAERRQAEGDARGGNGDFLNDVAHGIPFCSDAS